MVAAGEQKLCAAGNGAEFSDNQSVSVDGIVIEDVILFKLPGIVDEIIIDRVIAHLNIRSCDDVLQINALLVVGTGIDFVLHVDFLLLSPAVPGAFVFLFPETWLQ